MQSEWKREVTVVGVEVVLGPGEVVVGVLWRGRESYSHNSNVYSLYVSYMFIVHVSYFVGRDAFLGFQDNCKMNCDFKGGNKLKDYQNTVVAFTLLHTAWSSTGPDQIDSLHTFGLSDCN